VIMHMSLSTMLFLLVDVRDVGVFDRRVVVVMRMGGKQVHPVLTLMKVMGHVIVLMSMLDRLVLMTAVPLLHRGHPFRAVLPVLSLMTVHRRPRPRTTFARRWQPSDGSAIGRLYPDAAFSL
jgi:hypothetical protein